MVAGHIGKNEGANHFAFAFLSRHDSDWDLGYSERQCLGGAARRPRRLRTRAPAPGRVLARGHVVPPAPRPPRGRHLAVLRLPRPAQPPLAHVEEVTGGTSRAVFVGSEYEYNHGRALVKAGLAWRPGRWELGDARDPQDSISGPAARPSSTPRSRASCRAPFLSASTQKGLDATYHSPWSVAGGASWRGDAHRDPHDARVVLRRGRLRHPGARAGAGRRPQGDGAARVPGRGQSVVVLRRRPRAAPRRR